MSTLESIPNRNDNLHKDFKMFPLCKDNNKNNHQFLIELAVQCGIPGARRMSLRQLCDLLESTIQRIAIPIESNIKIDEDDMHGVPVFELPEYLKYTITLGDTTYCYNVADLEKEILHGNQRDHFSRFDFTEIIKKDILNTTNILKQCLNTTIRNEHFGERRVPSIHTPSARKQLVIDLMDRFTVYPVMNATQYEELSEDQYLTLRSYISQRIPAVRNVDRYQLALYFWNEGNISILEHALTRLVTSNRVIDTYEDPVNEVERTSYRRPENVRRMTTLTPTELIDPRQLLRRRLNSTRRTVRRTTLSGEMDASRNVD